jgi:hypothetical protein
MNSVREQSPSPSLGLGSPQKLTLPPLNVKTYMNSPMDSPRNPGMGGLGGKFGATAPLDLSMMTMATPDLRGTAPDVSQSLAGSLTVKKAGRVNQSFDAKMLCKNLFLIND